MVATLCPRAMQFGIRGVFYLLDAASPGGAEKQSRSKHSHYSGDALDLAKFLSQAEGNTKSSDVQFAAARSALDRVREHSAGSRHFYYTVLGETVGPKTTCHECPESPHHVTREYGGSRSLDLFGGPKISPIVLGGLAGLIVPEPMVAILSNSGFTGLQFKEWPIACNQTPYSPPPLYHVDGTGKSFLFPKEIVGGDNACGHCGYGPVICYACGDTLYRCPQCAGQVFIIDKYHEGASDPRIGIAAPKGDDQGCQVDASKWDGSDFVSLGDQLIVTRRVIDWLQRNRITPWVAESIKAEFENVSREQLDSVHRAAGRNWPLVKAALTSRRRTS